MIPGGNQDPYRAPCDGSMICGSGPRYQHARGNEKNISVYLYDTTVCSWIDCGDCPSLDGTTDCNGYTDCPCGSIAPYERYGFPTPDAPCTSPCQTGSGCTDPPCQPCGPWNYNATYPAPAAMYYQPQMLTAATVANGGSGYHVGDVLDASGGTTSDYISPSTGGMTLNSLNIIVTQVDESGAIIAVRISQAGSYQTNPSSPNNVTGGHGTGAQINFTFGNQTENLSPCFKYGFKNVQAGRYWHGQPGYYFNGGWNLYQCTDTCPTYVGYEPYTSSASQTKYTSMGGTSTVTWAFVNPGTGDLETVTGTVTIDLSVDPTSGVITNGSTLSGDPDQCCATMTTADGAPNAFDVLTMMFNTPQEWWDYMWNGVADSISGDTLTCTDTSFTAVDPDTGITDFDITWTVTDTSLTISNSVHDGLIIFSVSLADDSVSFSYALAPDDSGEYIQTNFTITLSGANTASDVEADVATLLNKWPLNDDALYPWRKDNYVSIAPLVTRNEHPGNISFAGFTIFTFCGTGSSACPSGHDCPTDTCAECGGGSSPCIALSNADGYEMVATTDPNAALYDGSIIGAPLPAGYQGTFDFNYINYQWCVAGGSLGNTCESGSDPSYFYIHGYGGYISATDAGVPLNATQWTDNQMAAGLPGGAWMFYNHNPSWTGCGDNASCYNYAPFGGCLAQKWAETKMGFPSQNFARPAGMDRFAFDETQVYGISATTNGTGLSTIGPGSQITLFIIPDCANPALTSGSIGGLWGGSAVGGFYELSGVSGGNVVTLGALVYKVPSNWDSASGIYDDLTEALDSDAAVIFGKLRWSTGTLSTDPPAILGRAGISAVAEYEGNPSISELTTDLLTTLGMPASANDSVDIYDKTMTLLSGNQLVTRIDDSHFTVPVGPSTLAGAAWIMSHGAAAYQWNDQYSKGDYVYTDWTWAPRLICEAQRINTVYASCAGVDCGGTQTTSCECSDISCETVPCFPFSAFTQTAACLPFNNCSPSVICISPNGESFTNGHTYDFPTVDFDEEYGSGWQVAIQQVMQDLLYQTPHYPNETAIGDTCTMNPFQWLSDDGTCATGTGTVEYYPHPPLVEARITMPSGAPSLPSGITIGWVGPEDVTGDCTAPADMLFPPGSVGFGLEASTLWTLWNNLCGCVSGNGIYADVYENEVTGCQ